ncbi:hypothetical protein ACFV8Z_38945, partial [Streptomyces sp. NPDC059837]|uniref:hypothetical protein n=1 Tax=Streptomyces sp. NPDC059837 TaxID=3346968 RepID=UPI0036626ECF
MSIDVRVDEQTMREVVLRGFEAAVAARAGAAMPRAVGQPPMPDGTGPVLSQRSASRGGNVECASVHQEHRLSLIQNSRSP